MSTLAEMVESRGDRDRAREGEGAASVKVVVDWSLCESNAVCMATAPTVFEVRDDDQLYLLQEHPDESLRDVIETAVIRCPRGAISIVDDDD